MSVLVAFFLKQKKATSYSMEVIIKDKTILIDEIDLPLFNSYVWNIDNNGYLQTKYRGHSVRLHRLIMGLPRNMEIDHINGNTQDNRRENLRIVTHRQNMLNTKLRKDNTSGFRGVSKCTFTYRSGKQVYYWVARIYVKGKKISLGYYKNVDEAVSSYNEAASKFYGKYKRA